jgi:hypothetical protein
MENNMDGPNRAETSRAATHRVVEHKEIEEGLDELNAELQEKDQQIRAQYDELERGKAFKKSLTDPHLIQAAEMAEENTLQSIVQLEQEKKDLDEKIEGRKRSLN